MIIVQGEIMIEIGIGIGIVTETIAIQDVMSGTIIMRGKPILLVIG